MEEDKLRIAKENAPDPVRRRDPTYELSVARETSQSVLRETSPSVARQVPEEGEIGSDLKGNPLGQAVANPGFEETKRREKLPQRIQGFSPELKDALETKFEELIDQRQKFDRILKRVNDYHKKHNIPKNQVPVSAMEPSGSKTPLAISAATADDLDRSDTEERRTLQGQMKRLTKFTDAPTQVLRVIVATNELAAKLKAQRKALPKDRKKEIPPIYEYQPFKAFSNHIRNSKIPIKDYKIPDKILADLEKAIGRKIGPAKAKPQPKAQPKAALVVKLGGPKAEPKPKAEIKAVPRAKRDDEKEGEYDANPVHVNPVNPKQNTKAMDGAALMGHAGGDGSLYGEGRGGEEGKKKKGNRGTKKDPNGKVQHFGGGGGGGGSRRRQAARAMDAAREVAPAPSVVGDTTVIVEHKDEDRKYVKPINLFFRFGAPEDQMSTLINIRDRVFVKVFTNLVEVIVQDDTITQSDFNFMAWMLSHAPGNLFVNTPLPDNPKKLVHIFNVKKHGSIKEIARALQQVLVRFPTHYVLQSEFYVGDTIFGTALMNKHSLKRLYQQVSLKLENEL